jgi:FAD/FMN-containing dehydrogenase
MNPSRNTPPCLTTDPLVLERYSRDTVYQGRPDYAYAAGDLKTLSEIITWCRAINMPITFCGSQTSMTGASAPDGGVVAALSERNKILEIGRDPVTKEPFVITEPGVILGDLKRAVTNLGFLYPPDPTSYEEAQIGATVATNATGEETFRFGPTRSYVDELEVLTTSGESRILKRSRPAPFTTAKNTAGYFLDGEEIDEVIGSEGTLALITRLKLRLVETRRTNVFVLILPFSKFENCVRAVPRIASVPDKPRALELIGPGAGAYFRRCPDCPEELKTEEIFLYVKDDYADETEFLAKTGIWYDFLKTLYDELGESAAFERLFVARTDAQLKAIRACRHFIPSKVNEEFFADPLSGGGKVGSDWWVPRHHIEGMMLSTYAEALEIGIPFLVFAHIGNGHPHWNFLTRTAREKEAAREFVRRQCRKASLMGGGVAGEHGIGKIKRDLLPIQHAPKTVQKMIRLKEKWDRDWIFGRGNIFKSRS